MSTGVLSVHLRQLNYLWSNFEKQKNDKKRKKEKKREKKEKILPVKEYEEDCNDVPRAQFHRLMVGNTSPSQKKVNPLRKAAKKMATKKKDNFFWSPRKKEHFLVLIFD